MNARSQTDDALRVERLLIDQIDSDAFAAAPGIAFQLRQAREQSESRLAEERKENDRTLLREQSARDAAVAALADREESLATFGHDRKSLLTDLMSNAIKITPRGGQISVTAARQERRVRIAVQDTGRGMSEADLRRIFIPYSILRHEERHGLGLGLSVSKSIVQAHGGKIWAESRLGSGSTFSFTVPGADGPLFRRADLDKARAN